MERKIIEQGELISLICAISFDYNLSVVNAKEGESSKDYYERIINENSIVIFEDACLLIEQRYPEAEWDCDMDEVRNNCLKYIAELIIDKRILD